MHYKLEDADLMNVVVSRADVDWISLCGMYCIANTGACMQELSTIVSGGRARFGPVDHSQHASRQSRRSGRVLNRWALLPAFYFYTWHSHGMRREKTAQCATRAPYYCSSSPALSTCQASLDNNSFFYILHHLA
jgi:hypothetical protein